MRPELPAERKPAPPAPAAAFMAGRAWRPNSAISGSSGPRSGPWLERASAATCSANTASTTPKAVTPPASRTAPRVRPTSPCDSARYAAKADGSVRAR